MDEIASQLGISKKTIYLSFADKDELVDATLEQHLNSSRSRCERDRLQAKNAIHEIFLTMDMLQELLANMNPAVFYDLEKYHPKTFAKLTRHRHDFLYQVVKNNIEWGIQDGLYREDVDVDVATKIRLETMFLPFNPIIFPVSKYSILDVEKTTIELFLYGVATAKAHKMIQKYKQQRLKQDIQ